MTEPSFFDGNDRERPARSDLTCLFRSPKILHHGERLDQYITGFQESRAVAATDRNVSIVPVTMEIDLTNMCSHRCSLCVGARQPDSNEETSFTYKGDGISMPTSRAMDYIGQMAQAGVRGLIFTGGGEPTMHSDLVPLVLYAARKGMDVGLITHGGLLHRHDVEALVTACTWIRVSIDSSNANEFSLIHGRDEREWQRVWSNVRSVVAEKRKLDRNGRFSTATVGVAFLCGPQNVNGILDFVRIARNAGIDYAQIRPFYRYMDFNVGKKIEKACRMFNTDTFEVLCSMHKYSKLWRGHGTNRHYDTCHLAQFSSVICSNEKMYFCCHFRNNETYCIGDLRKTSFANIIDGNRRFILSKTIDFNKCPPLCRGDHVNSLVENIIVGNEEKDPERSKPLHANFL